MPLPRAPQAVIFDMDGLLFDTEALYQRAFVEAAELGGYDVPREAIQLGIGLSWVRSRRLMLDALGAEFPIDEYYKRMADRFAELAATELRLKPGVLELLDALDFLELPRCIATSSAHETVRDHLAAHNLAGRFHDVIGHGDYENSKPSPDPFLVAAARLQVPASVCLALEDSHSGVRSAAAAGMMTIMVPDLVPPTDEIRDLCHAIVRSLHDVVPLITGRGATTE